MSRKKLVPVHPGEVLLEEFLKPMNLSQNRLALDIGVPPRRINEIVLGKRSVTADTPCAWGAISACRRSFGLACKWITIWTSPRMPSQSASTAK